MYISALASKMRQIIKIMAHYHANYWFDPYERPMAETEKYFQSIFGSNENFKICFRD